MPQKNVDTLVDNKLETLRTQADQVRELVDKLRQRVDEGELATGSGISFLEVKHHTMLTYITNLVYFTMLKLHGKQIESHTVISRLVEDRTVLEKMKPLEQRLKYQIDKLLRGAVVASENGAAKQQSKPKMATTDDPEAMAVADDSAKLAAAMLSEDALADPSAFKPNPGNLAADVREEDELAIESGVYRAPKQVPVHYEEEGNLKAKRERAEQRMMERAARSRLVRDLMTEYDDRPETHTATGNASVGIRNSSLEHMAEDKKRYEEDNFTRLTVSKKDRRGLRSAFTDLDDEFTHLNDFAGLSSLQKTDEASGSKAAILDRLKRKRDNESMADRDRRRRRGGGDSDEEAGFSTKTMRKGKKGKFQNVKRRMNKR
ncbi:hypothetical protein GQ54DRAFT_297810 [Martensiomyces pterosporus]|nr:hypothetical protein GQ54DRAFT_297810 [Martensiomyces pterosporus]